jgi:hypothetical protein
MKHLITALFLLIIPNYLFATEIIAISSNFDEPPVVIQSSILNFEPYLGYSSTAVLQETTYTNPRQEGFMLGARLPIQLYKYLFAGPEVSYLPAVHEYRFQPYEKRFSKTSDSKDHFRFGIILGSALPTIPVRIWLGYQFVDHKDIITIEPAGTTKTVIEPTTSWKIGASYTIKPKFLFNIEFIVPQTSLSNKRSKYNDNNTRARPVAFNAFVSLPLSIPVI